MRLVVYLLFILVVVILGGRIVSLFLSGELFKPNALKNSFRESGRTLWSGMKLFVVIWFLYLLFMWWVRNR